MSGASFEGGLSPIRSGLARLLAEVFPGLLCYTCLMKRLAEAELAVRDAAQQLLFQTGWRLVAGVCEECGTFGQFITRRP